MHVRGKSDLILVLIGNLYVDGVWLDSGLLRTPKDTYSKEISLCVHDMLAILSYLVNLIWGLHMIRLEIRPEIKTKSCNEHDFHANSKSY